MADGSIYKQLGRERKDLQERGELPDWVTTPAWQVLKSKYLSEGETLKDRFGSIAACAADKLPLTEFERAGWYRKFFDLLWKGWLAPSTPVLSNMGAEPFKGCPVSCSGSYIGDSVYDFYDNRLESAILSQQGFGTSGYLGDIRPRGSIISRGGKADGVVPVFKGHLRMARDISQGSTRRGSWAGYLPIEHGDFWELCNFVVNNPDDCNVGWNIGDDFISSLNRGDDEATARYQRSLKVKMVTGKGYYFFPDKVNNLNPVWYKDKGLAVKASNLCTEITLHSDEDHTFTCVLSSLNLSKYDEWKDTNAVFLATVFLDCVAQEFIEQGKKIKGLEKAVRFTERSRALGLGTLGWHTYLQLNRIPFESFDAHTLNGQIFQSIRNKADEATRWMAMEFGEPEWCRGYGVRNSHLLAIAPNLSSALICGSVSQGIEPIYMNAYTQGSSAGEIDRINPVLVDIMKERGVFNHEVVMDIAKNKGSVQHVDWMDDHEKKVFKTAFEIDQFAILRLAAARQQWIDQAQSINLFFAADEKEEVISAVHQEAFNNPMIKSLYYIRSEAGVKGSTGECEACAG
jgi:ribonucleoside-diphosphate reductase alpha chain